MKQPNKIMNKRKEWETSSENRGTTGRNLCCVTDSGNAFCVFLPRPEIVLALRTFFMSWKGEGQSHGSF